VDRRHGRNRGQASRFKPNAELADGLGVGAASMGVADLRCEELEETVSRAVARRRDQDRSVGPGREGDKLAHRITLFQSIV